MSERWLITSDQDGQSSGIVAIDLNTAEPWLLEVKDSPKSIVHFHVPRRTGGEGRMILRKRDAIHAMCQILQRARFDDAADHKAIDQAVELLKAAEQMLDQKDERGNG